MRALFPLVFTAIASSVAAQQAPLVPPSTQVPALPAPQPQVQPATLRLQVVREAAMSAAMRAGLAKQSEYINKLLDGNARLLDEVYDFGSIMLVNNVVPPVVRKIERVTEQSGDVLRYSAAQFQIVRQASFATRPPSWRTYLPIPIFTDTGSTHPSLMPSNAAEQEAAAQGIAKGWQAGIEQADQMFYKGLTRFQNDYLGMLTYHALLKSNMVTAPIVNRKDTPISGSADNMVVDQSTYRIEARPVFNPNLSQWLAVIDKSGVGIMESLGKLSEAEGARAGVSTPSLNELMRTWTGK